MDYEPNFESVGRHPRPAWYDDAKVGVFIHWGLYSVPAWAPRVPDIQAMLKTHDPAYVLAHNPYAEWYLNTMQIPGSPTAEHHAATYGADFHYDEFIGPFDERSADADLDGLADLCARAGARYVVHTTKHHDGFCLWPTSVVNAYKGTYHSKRDLVGDFVSAVRGRGMRAGLYYSAGYDWSYRPVVMASIRDALFAAPQDPRYAEVVDRHFRELIDRYEPSVLWNDIGVPPGLDTAAVMAHYYNTVADGVVNDRWARLREPEGKVARGLLSAAAEGAQRAWRFLPGSVKQLPITPGPHYDFTTPEYAQRDAVVEEKWESTRGVGHSFGANHNETADDIVSTTELVRMLVDIVAKNGNLLIGVGPDPSGVVPDAQQVPIRGMGEWLAVNGEAIYDTRPWVVADGVTTEGLPVRYTRNDDALHAILVEAPTTTRVSWSTLDASNLRSARLLGVEGELDWTLDGGRLTVTVPDRLPVAPAHVLRLSPPPRPRQP
jgi:alpha-L-fucosidase